VRVMGASASALAGIDSVHDPLAQKLIALYADGTGERELDDRTLCRELLATLQQGSKEEIPFRYLPGGAVVVNKPTAAVAATAATVSIANTRSEAVGATHEGDSAEDSDGEPSEGADDDSEDSSGDGGDSATDDDDASEDDEEDQAEKIAKLKARAGLSKSAASLHIPGNPAFASPSQGALAGGSSSSPLVGSASAAACSPSPSPSRIGGAGAFRVSRAPRDHMSAEQAKREQKEFQARKREEAQAQQAAAKESKREAIRARAEAKQRRQNALLAKQADQRKQARLAREARAGGGGGPTGNPFKRCEQQPYYKETAVNAGPTEGQMGEDDKTIAPKDMPPRGALGLLKRKSPRKFVQKPPSQQQQQQQQQSPQLQTHQHNQPQQKAKGRRKSGLQLDTRRAHAAASSNSTGGDISGTGGDGGGLFISWGTAAPPGAGTSAQKGWKKKGGQLTDNLGRPVDASCRRRVPHKCGPKCPYRRDKTTVTAGEVKLPPKKVRPPTQFDEKLAEDAIPGNGSETRED
jgi:hypothetical protein